MRSPTFIGHYPMAASTGLCSDLVNLMEERFAAFPEFTTHGEDQHNSVLNRKDRSIFLDDINIDLTTHVNQVLTDCLDKYYDEYSGLSTVNGITSYRIKLQKTSVGGGFMQWHCEESHFATSHRVLAWMIYLNDLPDGEGETEFLHQSVRLKPRKGDVVIFPSAFTHTHRGNPPLTTNKYIATGWFQVIE